MPVSLRDSTFIEHHFLDKIAILTKLSAKISLKLLQSTYNNIGTETAGQFQPQDNNRRWTSSFWPLQGFPRLN